MLKRPALWPRWRIARRLPAFQWRLVELLSGRTPAEDRHALVWRFLESVLGHANECLFDSELISTVDAITIPGGEDEANRFLVEVVENDPDHDGPVFERAMAACGQHRIRWLWWTDGQHWQVAHVRGAHELPPPFLHVDILQRPTRELVSGLFLLSFEGLLSSALERAWHARVASPGH